MRTSAPETIEYSLAANAINFPLMAACRAAEIMPKLKAAAKTNPNVRLVQYGIKLELSPHNNAKQSRGCRQ